MTGVQTCALPISFEFEGLETKSILYQIKIPVDTQIGKYFGTITLEDANRTTNIQVTLNVTEKPFYASLTEWIQQETIGIPNLIILLVVVSIIILIWQDNLKLKEIEQAFEV